MPVVLRRLGVALAALVLSSGLALAQIEGDARDRRRLVPVLSADHARASSSASTRRPASMSRWSTSRAARKSLKAVIGGSADVVSGYFDHCVNLAAKGQHLQSFVVYDRYPGFALVVSPKHAAEIKSIKDLANKKIGVSAPGSSTDFFLKYILKKNGVDPNSVGVIGVGLGATAVAAMEQGQVEAAIMLDPAVTILQGKDKDLKILSDTRSQKDTLAVFGGEYPGGALYTKAEWIAAHPKEVQAMTNAIVSTLKWIHSHTPEEIADKMPAESGRQGQGALSRGAQEHAGDVFGDRPHGPEGRRGGARRVQPVLARCGQGQHRPVEDLYEHLCRRGQQEDGNEVGLRSNDGRVLRCDHGRVIPGHDVFETDTARAR